MVCHIGGQLGTKVVISALGMLALYMCFNGTGIWGGETMCEIFMAAILFFCILCISTPRDSGYF